MPDVTVGMLRMVERNRMNNNRSRLLSLVTKFSGHIGPVILSFANKRVVSTLAREKIGYRIIGASRPFSMHVAQRVGRLVLERGVRLVRTRKDHTTSGITFVTQGLRVPVMCAIRK